jgi:succinyl-diaminopimelate desuccinylase
VPTTDAAPDDDAVLALAADLIRRPSVTPDDAGCQNLLIGRLEALGFRCERLRFGEVDNLWARRGETGPVLAFAGHTDVVPTGPEDAWARPPFEPLVENGRLFGRGASDMKGSLAAMVVAVERLLADAEPAGSLAFLITSDEEGPARDGTRRVMETLAARGETIDWCVVGEPSSATRLGDVVRIGRRGSLNGRLTVRGVQGHVAYPESARNPVHAALAALDGLARRRWDDGNEAFPPTSFQISNVRAGTGATNVVPGTLEVDFNFRFCTEQTEADLRAAVEAALAEADLEAAGCGWSVDWALSGEPFVTTRGALIDAVRAALGAEADVDPDLSTGGGTSDGRFIAPHGVEVVELGPENATIHQVDESVPVDQLRVLARVYEAVARQLLVRS